MVNTAMIRVSKGVNLVKLKWVLQKAIEVGKLMWLKIKINSKCFEKDNIKTTQLYHKQIWKTFGNPEFSSLISLL